MLSPPCWAKDMWTYLRFNATLLTGNSSQGVKQT